MARAEQASVDRMIDLETCGHFMCTCKTTLDDNPTKALVMIQDTKVNGEKMFTPLRITTGSQEKTVEIRGIHRREELIKSFNNCDGPEITASGIICGAVYRLERK